jgi:hypothetical protein
MGEEMNVFPVAHLEDMDALKHTDIDDFTGKLIGDCFFFFYI